MSALVYQPIDIPDSKGRCLSASLVDTTFREAAPISLNTETTSLPGQLDLDSNAHKFTISLQQDKQSNIESTLEIHAADDGTPTPTAIDSGCASYSTLSHHNTHTPNGQPSTSRLLSNTVSRSSSVNEVPPMGSTHSVGGDSIDGLSETSLEVSGILRQASKLAWVDNGSTSDHASPLHRSPDDASLHTNFPNRRNVRSSCTLKSCAKFILHVIVSLIVYSLLIGLAPFLLIVKLLAFLLCCIPCNRYHRHKTISGQTSTQFFDVQNQGGFYTAVIVLKERISSKNFVKNVVSKMSEAYDDTRKLFVHQLASHVRKVCCFFWRERKEKVELDQHIKIVDTQMSTTNDLMNFLAKISNEKPTQKDWMVHFVCLYQAHSSAIVLQIHHTLASRVPLKDTLIGTFATMKTDTTRRHEQVAPSLSTVVKIVKGPGVVLSHMLKFSSRPFGFQRLSGKQHFTISESISLTSVQHLVGKCDISMHSLFLAALTEALRTLSHFRNQIRSMKNITLAIPVSIDSHMSSFFVTLPLKQHRMSRERLFKNLEQQLLNNHTDAQYFLSAAKLGSYFLFSDTLNRFASSVAKQASGIFNVINCSKCPLYFDEHYAISNLAFWPPLFSKFRLGVSVMLYENTFRVCIVTDRTVTDWPKVFLSYYLSALHDLHNS